MAMTTKSAIRCEQPAALKLLERLCPDEVVRREWATLVSSSVVVASAISPDSWELSAFPSRVRLNVGQIAVLELSKRWACLYSQGRYEGEPTAGIRLHANWRDYTAVPRPNQRWRIDFPSLAALPPALLTQHHRLIETAATRKPRSPFMRAHSPGMVAAIELLAAATFPPRRPSRPRPLTGGFGAAELNKQVELRAVQLVTAKYQAEGWQVRSVEQEYCGYDLHCTRGRQEHHVEVKGASSTANRFLLTSNEFRTGFADDRFVLAFVDAIATQGHRIRSWSAREFRTLFSFDAVQYWAQLS